MSVLYACWGIAKDLDGQCSHISGVQERQSGAWACAPGGPSLKIAVEYGTMDISTIQSRMLGEHRLLIGSPINYASRIGAAGEGNRCHFGPKAAKMVIDAGYGLAGPFTVQGKPHEGERQYYVLDMGEIWREGSRVDGEDTYWD
jgi:class 3 adenylate cyclase